MTNDLIRYASIAGELAPNLYGRTDFTKYDGAWAEAHNWVVDYRGGLFTRAGLEFGDIIEWSDGQDVKFLDFQFSPDIANTYLIIMTDDKCRFAQDNAYILESAKTVASLANSTGDDVQFTSTAHGFENGDWVKLSGFTTNVSLNNRTAEVTNKATNTFELTDPITGEIIEIASVSTETGSVARIYTITSPYGEEELRELRAFQVRDFVRLTHPDYPVKNLIRNDQTDWEIADEDLSPALTRPGSLSVTGSVDDDRCCVYQVTSVDENGNESIASISIKINGPDIGNSNKENTIAWNAVTGARAYNVYRSRVIENGSGNRIFPDFEVGFIGTAIGTDFVDNGITPDFTKTPIIAYNPFANGAIRYVSVTSGGSGINYTDTITWPAGGSGAIATPIVSGAASDVTGFIIFDGGSGYTGTAVTISGGFVGVAELSAATDNNPHCSTLYQQRMVYGATDNNPLRLFGSQPGRLSNFGYSSIGADDDSYEFDLDSPKIAPIRHLMPVRGGLLVLNEIGVWLVSGINSEVLTGNNAQADYQNSVGVSLTQPIYVDSYVVYVAQAGQEVRMLAYDDYSKVYGGRNLSLLSNHLFDSDITVNSLTYSPVPSKVIYATQSNGRLLATTVDTENSVYAITPQWTKGYFRYCISLDEQSESRLYVAVERLINGNRVMYFERLEKREDMMVLEDSFCVDAGLRLTRTYPAARLTLSSLTGNVTFTASASVFSAGDVGKILRCGCGSKAEITGYTSGTIVTGTWIKGPTGTFPEDTDPPEFSSGVWHLDAEVTTINGLWHLEREEVAILADGVVVTGKTVTNGAITLDTAASSVIVGLKYTCRARTLPLAVSDIPIEGRRKRQFGVAFRMYQSLGLKLGASLAKLYDVANRAQRLWGTGDALRSEMVVEPLRTDWSRDNQIYFVQDTPRPAAILSVIHDIEVGDDKS
jgi:hypothetical protein